MLVPPSSPLTLDSNLRDFQTRGHRGCLLRTGYYTVFFFYRIDRSPRAEFRETPGVFANAATTERYETWETGKLFVTIIHFELLSALSWIPRESCENRVGNADRSPREERVNEIGRDFKRTEHRCRVVTPFNYSGAINTSIGLLHLAAGAVFRQICTYVREMARATSVPFSYLHRLFYLLFLSLPRARRAANLFYPPCILRDSHTRTTADAEVLAKSILSFTLSSFFIIRCLSRSLCSVLITMPLVESIY